MHDPANPDPLPLSAMTWAAMLARWTEFARASVAFPKDAPGERWRASVAPVIGLQATAFALGDIDSLPADERALGLDRAGVLVRAHAGELHRVWAGEAMPDALREVVDDAQRALTLARSRGVEFRVIAGRFETPDLLAALEQAGEASIDFALAAEPGTTLFRGEPVLFVRPAAPRLSIDGLEAVASPPRQVYRHAQAGGARDVIALFDDALQPGTPLLRVAVDEGR
ncbi:MAG: hypothetical protein ACTS27_10045, partial [Phycisphaerales bacterium]